MFEDLVPLWNAFTLLSCARGQAFDGIAPIAVSSITAYLDALQIDDVDTRHDYLTTIVKLDAEFRKLNTPPPK